MQRRDFLFLRLAADREIELSCERLYMRFVDAQVDGTVRRLFESLAADLADVKRVRLVDRSWLASADFKREIDAVLAAFQRRGGDVVAK